jgi:hypothetical protein
MDENQYIILLKLACGGISSASVSVSTGQPTTRQQWSKKRTCLALAALDGRVAGAQSRLGGTGAVALGHAASVLVLTAECEVPQRVA